MAMQDSMGCQERLDSKGSKAKRGRWERCSLVRQGWQESQEKRGCKGKLAMLVIRRTERQGWRDWWGLTAKPGKWGPHNLVRQD